MAEIVLGIGTSHSPLLLLPAADWVDRGNDDKRNPKLNLSDGRFLPYAALEAEVQGRYAEQATPAMFLDQWNQCQKALDRLADEIAAADPQLVIIVGDDQEELFDLRCMPAFAVYCGEQILTRPLESMDYIPRWLVASQASAGYAMDTVRHYPAAPDFGRFAIDQLMNAGVDVTSVSAVQNPGTQGFGHAYGFVIQRLYRGRSIPTLPILLNTYYPPNRPTPSRCYQIGELLRRVVSDYPKELRVAVVASGGLSHFVCDEELDRSVLQAIGRGDCDTLKNLPRASLNSGSSEIANWITVAGAMQGHEIKWHEYVPVHRTPAGTGIGLTFLTWK
jgi:Catalytic LigB subunit of aromatic ring-opening dioxygenase